MKKAKVKALQLGGIVEVFKGEFYHDFAILISLVKRIY